MPGINLISGLTRIAVDHDSMLKGRHLVKRDKDRGSALRCRYTGSFSGTVILKGVFVHHR